MADAAALFLPRGVPARGKGPRLRRVGLFKALNSPDAPHLAISGDTSGTSPLSRWLAVEQTAVCPFGGRQFRELTGSRRWRSEPLFEFNLVTHRDPVGARYGDLGLQPAAAVTDGVPVYGGQLEAAAESCTHLFGVIAWVDAVLAQDRPQLVQLGVQPAQLPSQRQLASSGALQPPLPR
jgi:hypothetical protein